MSNEYNISIYIYTYVSVHVFDLYVYIYMYMYIIKINVCDNIRDKMFTKIVSECMSFFSCEHVAGMCFVTVGAQAIGIYD
jgi:hypothetical protein